MGMGKYSNKNAEQTVKEDVYIVFKVSLSVFK